MCISRSASWVFACARPSIFQRYNAFSIGSSIQWRLCSWVINRRRSLTATKFLCNLLHVSRATRKKELLAATLSPSLYFQVSRNCIARVERKVWPILHLLHLQTSDLRLLRREKFISLHERGCDSDRITFVGMILIVRIFLIVSLQLGNIQLF